MKTLVLFTDGAARGNPGPAGIGVSIQEPSGTLVAEIAEYLGEATNNQAEYRALVAGLERALALGAECVDIRADSELMVRQVEGRYQVKNAGLKPLFVQVRGLLSRFDRYTIQHVRREQNAHADALANQAIDTQT